MADNSLTTTSRRIQPFNCSVCGGSSCGTLLSSESSHHKQDNDFDPEEQDNEENEDDDSNESYSDQLPNQRFLRREDTGGGDATRHHAAIKRNRWDPSTQPRGPEQVRIEKKGHNTISSNKKARLLENA